MPDRCDASGVESLAGKLLISSPSLVDPNFRRTVVLMTHHDEEGAVGLVLSRPSELRIAEAVPDLDDLPCADEVVYVGGPVQPEAVVVLVELDEPHEEAQPIVGRVAYMPPGVETWEALGLARPGVRRLLRLGPGPARGGARGAGVDRRAARSRATSSPPTRMSSGAVLQRKGGLYSLIASMPYDPSLN